ncbi:hypothetical protein BRO17_02985, partial [Xanthomonas oryzae pv. oryzae]
MPPCRIVLLSVPNVPTRACCARYGKSPWPGWPWCWSGRLRVVPASGLAGCRCGWSACRCW